MASTKVLLSPPDVGDLEQSLVREAIQSGWVAPNGPFVDSFEDLLREISGRRHAIAVNSGTSALHLSLLSLGVGQGDVVICSTLTFVATANAIKYVGATPVFVDSESKTGNVSTEVLEQAIDAERAAGKRVAAFVSVDFLGCMADYPRILELCEAKGIAVVADAAESLGSSLNGEPSGSFGRIAAFSFNGNKIATTSGGGAVVTDDKVLADKVRFLASQAREPVNHYEHRELGYNYRLSNISAAIGVGQVRRIRELVDRRRQNRENYRQIFSPVSGVHFLGRSDLEDNCWLTSITIDSKRAGFTNRELMTKFSESGIESRLLWKPMHLQPLYSASLAHLDGTSDKIYETGLALPSGSGMTDDDWDRIRFATSDLLK